MTRPTARVAAVLDEHGIDCTHLAFVTPVLEKIVEAARATAVLPASTPEPATTWDDKLDFASYHTEAMAFSEYPRVDDPATRERVAEVLAKLGGDVDHEAITWTIQAVLKDLPVYPALAMCGEAGEAAEKIKKGWRDGGKLDAQGVLKELGDVLWYITAAARDLGFTLEDVARANIEKLRGRRSRGSIHGSGDDR